MMISKWQIVKDTLQTIAAVVAAIGIIFAWLQVKEMGVQTKLQTATLQDNRKIASASFVKDISQYLNNPVYDPISIAIDSHRSDWPLLKPRGQFSVNDIEDYINNYDMVGNLYNEGLIQPQMAYDEFSYEVEKAYCNNDVKRHVDDMRKTMGDSSSPDSFYYGFEKLAIAFMKQDKYRDCSPVDKQ